MRLPVALHATHGAAVTIWPRIERRTSRTSPAPPQTSHRGGMGAGFAAVAAAALARDGEAHLDGGGGPERGLREVEVHHGLGVGRARRAGLAARVAERAAAEERVEEVAEAEGVTRTAGTAGTAAADALLAEHVVAAALLRVAQRLVRDPDLLEGLLGARVVGVGVGVVLARHGAVRPLDLVLGGVALDAEELVVVGHESTSPSCRLMASTAASAWR